MKTTRNYLFAITALFAALGAFGCQQPGGNSTGSEFIPEMVHGPAYEANVLSKYSLNTFDEESTLSRRRLSNPRLPVPGTIARGFTGMATHDGSFPDALSAVLYTQAQMRDNGFAYAPSGHVPYYYADNDSARTLATNRIIFNPFPITAGGLARGKELYGYYCGVCHGDKGVGDGHLYDGPNAKYGAKPANLASDSLIVFSSNGRYYHAIMHGKNMMGSYADKLSFEERWQVIHYVRSLQADARKVKYNEQESGLNPNWGLPKSKLPVAVQQLLPAVPPTGPPPTEEQEQQEKEHGEGAIEDNEKKEGQH